MQRIEPGFWRDLKKFNAEAAISAYSYKTRLITIVPMQDDIFERNDISFYDKHSISCIRLKGNHAFTDTEDRKALISEIKCMLETAKN